MGTVWILNLDCEAELERPRGYAPSGERLARNRAYQTHAAKGLLASGDVLWRDGEPAQPEWRGLIGRAWCPTPRALERMDAGGLRVAGPTPALEILQRVNDRGFCASLGQFLPGARFLERGSNAALTGLDPSVAEAGGWLLKRSFGVAGRGRRKVRDLEQITEADANWIRASLKLGGLQIEPWCDVIEAEFVQEGVIEAAGSCRFGSPLVQECTAEGAWISCAPVRDELSLPEQRALRHEGESVAQALHAAGYCGPFALDAYRAVMANGEKLFVARSEINARYSMGWSMGPPGD